MRRRSPTYAPGSLSERVQLLRLFADHGQQAFLETPASKLDQGTREFWKDGTTKAEVASKFTIRWSPKAGTLRPQDAVLHDGQRYEIRGITEVGRREWIEITAVRRTDLVE